MELVVKALLGELPLESLGCHYRKAQHGAAGTESETVNGFAPYPIPSLTPCSDGLSVVLPGRIMTLKSLSGFGHCQLGILIPRAERVTRPAASPIRD
jgi:hypothetical protein